MCLKMFAHAHEYFTKHMTLGKPDETKKLYPLHEREGGTDLESTARAPGGAADH